MRGQGRIYARGDALWVSYYQGGDRREAVSRLAGKIPSRTTWDDAVKVLKRRLEQKAEARLKGSILTPTQERMSVAAVIDAYTAHRLAEGMKRPVRFKQNAEALKDWWGHLAAHRLTRELLEGEINRRRTHFTAGTIKNRLAGLYAALRHCQDRLPRLPAKPKVSAPDTRKGTWSAEELEQFCAVVPAWVAEVVRFGYLTGWRISECLGLTWDRVKGGLLYLDDTKSNEPRVRPIEPAMADLLARRTKARHLGCPLVFHVHGRAISADRFNWQRRQALKKAGMPHRFFHDLRRSFYDRHLLSGANLLDVMDLVGHKSLTSARRYARPSVARMRETLERAQEGRG